MGLFLLLLLVLGLLVVLLGLMVRRGRRLGGVSSEMLL
jgi:hypothetical protein